tara:strand:+ start:447 stop:1085 length:639 start_codon:yes stop_codon:yes gene_type:complete
VFVGRRARKFNHLNNYFMRHSISAIVAFYLQAFVTQPMLPKSLVEIYQRVYIPLGFDCSHPEKAHESAEYCAYSFALNEYAVQFRVAKTTPTKIGQFVTLWKRSLKGPIQPFDNHDAIDFVVINTQKEEQFGQFVFPKAILCKKNILSMDGKGGKRAIRVYPPWDIAMNQQAKKTQQWQLQHFLDIPQKTAINLARAKLLYGMSGEFDPLGS